MTVKMKLTPQKKIAHRRKKHHPEHYFGPDQQEMTCPYCRKTMNAMRRLFIHIKIQPQEGHWNIETCPKLMPEETPRGKWAKVLLRMKGNVPEIKLRKEKYPQQPKKEIAIYTKASDRKKKGRNRKKKTKLQRD